MVLVLATVAGDHLHSSVVLDEGDVELDGDVGLLDHFDHVGGDVRLRSGDVEILRHHLQERRLSLN